MGEIILYDAEDLGVGCCYQADGPVGAKEDPVCPEGLYHGVDIDPEMFWLPVIPVGFGDHPGDLAAEVGIGGYCADGVFPFVGDIAVFDMRFGNMIEDEGLVDVEIFVFAQFEIAAPPSRLRKGHRGAGAAALADVGVDPAKTFDDIGIEVVDDRVSRFAGGGEKGVADWQIEP